MINSKTYFRQAKTYWSVSHLEWENFIHCLVQRGDSNSIMRSFNTLRNIEMLSLRQFVAVLFKFKVTVYVCCRSWCYVPIIWDGRKVITDLVLADFGFKLSCLLLNYNKSKSCYGYFRFTTFIVWWRTKNVSCLQNVLFSNSWICWNLERCSSCKVIEGCYG